MKNRIYALIASLMVLLFIHITINKDKLLVFGAFGQECIVWLYHGEIIVDYYGTICTPVVAGMSSIMPTGRQYNFYDIQVGVLPYGNTPIKRVLTLKNFQVQYIP